MDLRARAAPRAQQLPLFPTGKIPQDASGSPATQDIRESGETLHIGSSLDEATEAFHRQMRLKGFTKHTINSFSGDLSLLSRYLGANRSVGSISTRDLKSFLGYLRFERGKPCSPKSYARRLTTLKVFFQWLAESEIIASDPAAPIAHEEVSSPLPQILFDDEVERLVEAGQQLRMAAKPDTRPLLLFQLLLRTGIKKGECMAIRLSDIDLSDKNAGILQVRYDSPRHRYKERRLSLGAGFALWLNEYRAQYHPQIHLFECTPRNLEYVLRDLAFRAGVSTPVSFETLRMTCAVRDYQRGMDSENLRRKLGLSRISWEETSKKIARLAAEPL